MYLKVHSGLCGLFDSLRAQVCDHMHMREDVKKRDIHTNSKSYKLELLRELVFNRNCKVYKKTYYY